LLTAEHLDVPLDFESVQSAGSLLGTGAVIVIDESDCIIEVTRRMLQFYAHESCGKCTPCREGTWWVSRVLQRIEGGYGREDDLPLLEDQCGNMLFRGFCALLDGAVSPLQSSLKHFRDEYEAHVRERRCPFTGKGPRVPEATPVVPAEPEVVPEVLEPSVSEMLS
jgi:NADH-quinone oxidoreductase subunit F